MKKGKLLKVALSFTMAMSYVSMNIADSYADVLETNGIKTEYEMLELQRNNGSSVVPGQNLLVNGDFEAGNTGWNTKNGAYISNWKDGTVGNGYNGSDYYGVLSVDETDCNFWQQVSVTPNTDYVIKAKVMVGKEGGQAIIAAKYNYLAATITETSVKYDAAYAWVYQDVELRFNSGSHDKIEVAVMKWTDDPNSGVAKSQVHVDNIELCQLVEGDESLVGLIQNGDFTKTDGWLTTGDGCINDSLKGNGDNTGFLLSQSGNASVYQRVSLKANTDYTMKAQVLLAKAGAYGFLAVKSPTVENLNPTIEKTITCHENQEWQWQDVELSFNSGSNTAVTICFIKWLDNGDRVDTNPTFNSQMYIDNIELIEKETTEVEKEVYTVKWADEFNGQGDVDSNGLDLKSWGYELGSIRGVEQQHYTKDKENVHVDDGKLILEITNRAKEDQYKNPRGYRQVIYNSGSVRTHGKQEFLFGRIEVLASLPEGQATFPAFWTLGADFTLDGSINGEQGDGWPISGEIDIMESIGDKNTVYETLHYNNANGEDSGKYAGNGKTTRITTKGVNIDGDVYHVFGINWSKGKIEWYIDDQIVRTVDYSDDAYALAALDRPQYIQLNFATGGNWPGDAGKDLAGKQFKIEYAYYAQNQQQEKDAAEYYANTVSIQAQDMVITEGQAIDLLKDVSLVAGENGNVDEFTLDYSIDNEYMFTSSPCLDDTNISNDEARTRVDCLIKTNDPNEVAKLPVGEYNIHISAMHDSKPNVRKTVKLTVLPEADYSSVDEAINKIPTDLSLYTDESVKVLMDAKEAVIYHFNTSQQEDVNAMAKAIEDAIEGLVKKSDITIDGDESDNGTTDSTDKVETPDTVIKTNDNQHGMIYILLIILSLGYIFIERKKRYQN